MFIEFLRNCKAVAAIEFALALPVLVVLFIGMINMGMVISTKMELTSIVSVGMLYSLGNSSDPVQIQTAMNSASNLSPITISVTQFCQCLNGSAPGCGNVCSDLKVAAKYDKVTASTQVPLVIPYFLFQNPFPITVEGTIRVQ